ncbi:MAG: tRNA uridine-5-carboxymethylaminomethyl(34) synthesis GTPase MnmE [Rhizobiales bacterium]|nr:tRNA uridine-5-carboxymethylaminomethyl(34) synthesis GTPase MnmE [Hyphomicrobiales bacterium]
MEKTHKFTDTIFALSSGTVPAGVAVLRVSGPEASRCFAMFHVKQPVPRFAQLCELKDDQGRMLDQALVLWFPAPHSFTGEDVVELHLHGSLAVLDIVFEILGARPGWRMADAGEFTRRAFENGHMDMTEVEGLGDLLQAQTQAQHAQALNQYSGVMSALYEGWRTDLLKLRAAVEADFDFADEEDVSGSVADEVSQHAKALADDIKIYLDDGRRGEIIREGLKVVLAGKPNVGKSSLMNELARRDLAIVTDTPGTTRDVLTVSLNLDGQLIILSDTAGIRDAQDAIEQEGIRRAELAIHSADVVLWLEDIRPDAQDAKNVEGEAQKLDSAPFLSKLSGAQIIRVTTKVDLLDDASSLVQNDQKRSISVKTGFGIEGLLHTLSRFGSGLNLDGNGENMAAPTLGREGAVITRQRHRLALQQCVIELQGAGDETIALEFRVEYLRRASDALGVILGRIGVEDILGQIFSDFCIGK